LSEWDPNQHAANLTKHGLDLAGGIELFDGRAVYSYKSPRSDEARLVTVGSLAGTLAALVWVQRGDAVRLISLRRARDAEKTAYRARYA
jgi:uncharacterized DUF497 family protein